MPADEPFRPPYDLGEWRELTKQAQWDSLQAYGDLLTRVAPDGWPRRWADLNVRYYEEVLAGTQALTDQWFEAVERVTPDRRRDRRRHARHEGHEGQVHDSDERRRVPMSLHAAVGDTARGSVSLHNHDRTDTEISFLVSDFTSADGESIRPTVAIRPERFVLGPLQERVVVIEVTLDPELFPPGVTFHATVAVRGYDDLELALTVRADEAGE